MEPSEAKKARIRALTTEEMLYEINKGRRSKFRGAAFDYLRTCYELRKSEAELAAEIEHISPKPTTRKAENKEGPHPHYLKWLAISVIAIVLGAMVLWLINHFLGLDL